MVYCGGVAIGLAAIACGDDGISKAEFCERQTQDLCSKLFSCTNPEALAYKEDLEGAFGEIPDIATCISKLGESSVCVQAECSGDTSYQRDNAQECIEKTEDETCDQLFVEHLDIKACQKVCE